MGYDKEIWNLVKLGTLSKQLDSAVSLSAKNGVFKSEITLNAALTVASDGVAYAFGAVIGGTTSPTLSGTGKAAAFYVGKTTSGTAKWPLGLYIDPTSVSEGISVGSFASGYASGSGVVMSSSVTAAARFYGESTSNLTSAVNARVCVFRHLVVTASATIAHETYGAIGQVCVKSSTLTHLHAGLMGTFEVSTAATVNGMYTYGVGAVTARLGVGTSLLTCTTPISAFSAIYNGGALVSGASVAYSSCGTLGTNFTYWGAVHNCDNFLYAATGSAYEHGIKIGSMTDLGGVTHACSGLIRVKVGTTLYYIPLYAASQVTGE